MKTLIKGGIIVNEGRSYMGDLMINNDRIEEIFEGGTSRNICDAIVDATGCFVLPGVIDEHVHFREPGFTAKANIKSESRAAAYGGVTSFFDMPNTKPQTTTVANLREKFLKASKESAVNYSFFFGATNDNADLFGFLDRHHIPGIKLFMGSSTGNMLVDKESSLEKIFREAAMLDLPVMTHCEDTDIINRNMAEAKKKYGEDPDISYHSVIRSEEACYKSSAFAVSLARKYGTHLHIAHISTAKELELLGSNVLGQITGEACIGHLYFSEEDYGQYGAMIKCNPAIKSDADRTALQHALINGKISCIATDHAPHLLKEKQGGCCKAFSGMPMIQYSLVTMLELVDNGVLPIEKVVELMCHNPARLFKIDERGFLREGYKADIVIVDPHNPFVVTKKNIQSKCKWSPMMLHQYQWQVVSTICNGHLIYNKGVFDDTYTGEELKFRM